ncbi:MAG: 5-(carboxyamino)imidazole ribonucleotide synthase [Phycisphaerales bacterium]|nr:5-(carboxyamino)imidazole ribonucleotide synthase [Phycisphaerales bacterium]
MAPLVGILGGGQLARMLALAGHPLGMRFRILDPSPDAPAAPLAEHIRADYTDPAALARFTTGLDVVTYEFENIPAACIDQLPTLTDKPIYPPPVALKTGQDRLLEKQLFQSLDIPVARFADITSLDDLKHHHSAFGAATILKTRRLGYDGKGQVRIPANATHTDLAAAWKQLATPIWPSGPLPPGHLPPALLLEQLIPFIAEASMLAVRSPTGDIRTSPLIRNEHKSGILRWSHAPFSAFTGDLPASIDSADLEVQAIFATRAILDALNYTGLLAVEFFIQPTPNSLATRPYTLIANEIAPRVHNSGHWTIEGSITSQFENHLRAIVNLPLGNTAMRFPDAIASMSNFIGSAPSLPDALEIPGVHMHLYGKDPKPARKVGHATIVIPKSADAAPIYTLQSLADRHWA